MSEYATIDLDPAEFNAQFYFEDTYVVRWKYKVSLTGECPYRDPMLLDWAILLKFLV